jgi:hypothetical protein
MYRRNRFVIARAAFVLAFAVAACSDNDGPPAEPEAGTEGGSAGTNGGAGSSGAGGVGGASGAGAGAASGNDGSAAASGVGGAPDPDIDGGADEGVDGDLSLADLSDQEIKELCRELAELSDMIASPADIVRLGCVLLASAFSGSGGEFDVATCEASVQSCLLNDEGVVSTMRCEPEKLREATVGCVVTVDQYRACAVAGAERTAEWVDAFSCTTLAESSSPSPMAIDTSPSSIPECAPVEAACPTIFISGNEPAEDGCDETCIDAKDDFCDDGGPGSYTNRCALGTDCTDCGPR